eukprot:jgi/Tetstr1/440793/TSEL_029100.t1
MRPELLYLAAAGVVAAQFNVRIDDCDRKAIKNAVSRRVAAAKQLAIFKKSIEAYVRPSLLPQGQENVLPYSSTVTVPEAPDHVRGVNQSKSGRKKMDTISAAADATTKGFKGASSHHEYQNLLKEACKVATGNKLQNGVSYQTAGKSMRADLHDKGISIGLRTCTGHIKRAITNDGVPLTPPKPRGIFVPSSLEDRIATVGMLIGHLKPMEMARHEWLTEHNLADYYEVAKGVLLKVGVARVNPDFQPDVPYGQEINITHLERITSYDETKLELECTKGGKGKGDMIVRACHADDGEGVVPKTTSWQGDAAAEESEQTKANEDVGNPVGDDDDDDDEEEQEELGGEEEEEEEEEDTGADNASGEEDEDDDDEEEEEEESDEEEGEEDWRRG